MLMHAGRLRLVQKPNRADDGGVPSEHRAISMRMVSSGNRWAAMLTVAATAIFGDRNRHLLSASAQDLACSNKCLRGKKCIADTTMQAVSDSDCSMCLKASSKWTWPCSVEG